MENKKMYEMPQMEIVEIKENDVIRTSLEIDVGNQGW